MKWYEKDWIWTGILVLLTGAVFYQTLNFDFVNFDDNVYVYNNPYLQELDLLSFIQWSFNTDYVSSWNPLMWLSYRLDYAIWGINPSGFHLSNVLLHLTVTALIFRLLRSLGFEWWLALSLTVAFAIHPQRVESVSWVTERKGLLAAVLGLGSLLCYLRYTNRGSKCSYGISLLLYLLSLSSKSTFVALPLMVVLLDYWPLKQIQRLKDILQPRYLFMRLPYFLLSFGTSALTLFAFRGARSDNTLELSSLEIGNAYLNYIIGFFHIGTPAPVYLREDLYWWPRLDMVLLGLLVLASVILFIRARSFPLQFIGWSWFVLVLFPVTGIVPIGILSAGPMAMFADRFSYLPHIGLLILLGGIIAHVQKAIGLRSAASIFAPALGIWIAILLTHTISYLPKWKNSQALWEHALNKNPDNPVAHSCLSSMLFKEGNIARSLYHAQSAVRLHPNYASAQGDLGMCHYELGNYQLAQNALIKALRLDPDLHEARSTLGMIHLRQGNNRRAEQMTAKAFRHKKTNRTMLLNYVVCLLANDKPDQAEPLLHAAIQRDAHFPKGYLNLALIEAIRGNRERCEHYYQIAVRQDPSLSKRRQDLDSILNHQITN
jgi:Flp pilus assembly protein TadD